MKRIFITLTVVLVLIGCSTDFLEDSLTGPVSTTSEGNQIMSLVLSRSVPGDAWFKSDMWINADSIDTEYRQVQFTDSLSITTLVSEIPYKNRVSAQGVVYYTGYTIGGVEPTHWTLSETEGPWFWGSVDPQGQFVQNQDNLADTIIVLIEVYAAQGADYYFNGTGTDFDNRIIPWNSSTGSYQVDMVTLPGAHRYDWWGSGIDSVSIGNTTIYDISGEYIRFQILDANQVTLLDSLSGMHQVAWHDTSVADTVNLRLSDRLGDRNYSMSYQFDHWASNVVIPSDTLVYLRLEADGAAKFTNVEVNNTILHHLVERGSSQYWFAFQLVDNSVVQDSNNVVVNVNINP